MNSLGNMITNICITKIRSVHLWSLGKIQIRASTAESILIHVHNRPSFCREQQHQKKNSWCGKKYKNVKIGKLNHWILNDHVRYGLLIIVKRSMKFRNVFLYIVKLKYTYEWKLQPFLPKHIQGLFKNHCGTSLYPKQMDLSQQFHRSLLHYDTRISIFMHCFASSHYLVIYFKARYCCNVFCVTASLDY